MTSNFDIASRGNFATYRNKHRHLAVHQSAFDVVDVVREGEGQVILKNNTILMFAIVHKMRYVYETSIDSRVYP